MTTDDSTAPDRFPDQMNASGAVLWDIEQDPVLRSTITAVAILDRAPDWDRLVGRIDYATRVIPRLRQRVIAPPLRLGPPRWVVDPGFDLTYHLRRTEVPAPGTLREVLDVVLPLSIAAFDRARPLWEFTLVEGMKGGRAAFVQKIHHTLTDGIGGIELALSILDERRDADDPDLPPEPEAGQVDAVASVRAALVGGARSAIRVGGELPLAGIRAAVGTVRDPVGSVRRARDMASSVVRMLAPVPRSASPLLTDRSLRLRFETIDMPLADLKAAARSAGCTTNDAFLASVVEGLRRYHARHDVEVHELRVTMPISLRHAGEELGGNHFAPVRFAVPTDISDPVERMRRLGAIARQWRSEPALDYSDAIAVVLERLPAAVTTGVFGAMLKHVDAVVTNIPGIPTRSFLAGAEMLREYAFAPPTGAAINVALLSHVDTACVGVVSDSAAVPDHEVWLACLVEGFDDVLRSTGHHARRSG